MIGTEGQRKSLMAEDTEKVREGRRAFLCGLTVVASC
jgi:hypothetical protein